MPGKRYASLKRPRVYEALRRKGMSKTRAAKISNSSRRGGGRRRWHGEAPEDRTPGLRSEMLRRLLEQGQRPCVA